VASSQVQACIAKARELRLRVAENSLNALVAHGLPFEGPAAGITLRIQWAKDFGGRLKQIAFYPIALALILVLLVGTPFFYVGHLRKVAKAKADLKRKISLLRAEPPSTEAPEHKTLDFLWALHGVEEDECNFDERLQLLSDWIAILYGPGLAEDLRLRDRIEEIARGYSKANRSYYEGRGGPHFHFKPPLDALISKLSGELPRYDHVRSRVMTPRRPESAAFDLNSVIEALKGRYRQAVGLVSSVEGRFANAWEAGIFVSSVATTKILSLKAADPPAVADNFNAQWLQYLLANPLGNGAPAPKSSIVKRMQEKFPVYRKLFLNAIDPSQKDKASDHAVQLMWELFTNCTGKPKPDDEGNFVKLVPECVKNFETPVEGNLVSNAGAPLEPSALAWVN